MTPADRARLTALRHDLHRFPEISGDESQTAARMAQILHDLGADQVLTGIGGHSVAAVFDSGQPGPSVAIRCELDALPIPEMTGVAYTSQNPGKSHLCGHDGHMVMAVAVAESLAELRPKRGRALVFFQAAEETGKGAVAFRADPRFLDLAPDYVFSLHNLPGLAQGTVELCYGATNCASRGMRIVLTGKTSHAAAPQDGLSPGRVMAQLMPALTDLGTGGDLTSDDSDACATGRGDLWHSARLW